MITGPTGTFIRDQHNQLSRFLPQRLAATLSLVDQLGSRESSSRSAEFRRKEQ
jgi:hypothetical protein